MKRVGLFIVSLIATIGFGWLAGYISNLLRPQWVDYSGEMHLALLIVFGVIASVGLSAMFGFFTFVTIRDMLKLRRAK